MTRPRVLTLTVELDSESLARAVEAAVAVEAQDAPPRTSCRVSRDGARVELVVESDDTRGLRAGANSYLRWLDTAVEVARAGGAESFKPRA